MKEINFNWYRQQIINGFTPNFRDVIGSDLEQFVTDGPAITFQNTSLLQELSFEEQLIAFHALSRYLAPEQNAIFFSLILLNPQYTYLNFGSKQEHNRQFIPGVESAIFLIQLLTKKSRSEIIADYLQPHHPLFARAVLKPLMNDPLLQDSELECNPEFIYRLVRDKPYYYTYSAEFPATPVIAKQNWDDLILPFSVKAKIDELITSIRYHQEIVAHPTMSSRFKENVLALFSGEPGTGKTLTAGLLGRELNMPVYRIDLSRLVSKWVGETTKNLRNLFDVAENKQWVLFFDEADSVFGKRSKGSGEANDHYHNQDISYLLQRIDTYKGFIILATNLGINIDDAFRRRIDTEITFMLPDKETRIRLWAKAFEDSKLTFSPRGPKKLHRLEMRAGNWNTPDEGINLEELAEYWDRVTGAKVNKVMKRLLIESMTHNNTHLPSGVIVNALQAELGLRKM